MRRQRTARVAIAGLFVVTAAGLLAGCKQGGEAGGRETPSGLPVPRYVTLKFDEVNARAAPDDDARLLFIYRAKRLPVQVLAETAEWRRVCDPQGRLVWVHRRTTDGRRSALPKGDQPVALRERPEAEAPIVAYLRPQALAALGDEQTGWRRLEVGGTKGWAAEAELWGVDPAPQCRGLTAADVVERGAVIRP